MMALNIAVPLTTVGSDLMDGFGLLSPISPLSVDCGGVVVATATPGSHGKGKQQMVSPVGSESSGVSSLDSDEIKKPTSPPTTPTEEVERPTTSSPIPMEDETVVQQDSSVDSAPDSPSSASSSSSSSSARSSLSSTSSSSSSDSDSGSSSEQESTGTTEVIAVAAAAASADVTVEEEEHALLAPELPPKECKLVLGGRDVLNLMDNLTAPNHFRLQFAQLPENDNIHFFLDNRSQYHRLGANGHIQEYTMVGCKRCDFRYPVNGTSFTSAGPTATMGQSSLAAAFQQQPQPQQPQQQQQQQQLQWNLNSISNSRDKMSSLNAAAAAVNAFNKTFGGGNQYFRNGGGAGAGAAGLFGRDSNRQGAANFLNATSTGNSYNSNNHKTYQHQQQSKFNAAQFGSYQQQQQQQQQQQFFSKNHQMRYGGQSSAAAAAAVATLANQNLINFNSFGSKNSANNNMFAYYKTMM